LIENAFNPIYYIGNNPGRQSGPGFPDKRGGGPRRILSGTCKTAKADLSDSGQVGIRIAVDFRRRAGGIDAKGMMMKLLIRAAVVAGLAAVMFGGAAKAAVALPAQDVFDLLRKNDVSAVKAMIGKTPGLVEARDGQGLTLLHYAASGSDAALIDLLVDKGAKIDLAGGQAKTPLHIAASNDRTVAAAALVKRGAALEIRDEYGRTALILCARERGRAATARVLLDAGADINAADLKLEELVKDMNAATGDARIAAIAQVVNELVRQQRTMHQHMRTMDQQMMKGMMGGRGM